MCMYDLWNILLHTVPPNMCRMCMVWQKSSNIDILKDIRVVTTEMVFLDATVWKWLLLFFCGKISYYQGKYVDDYLLLLCFDFSHSASQWHAVVLTANPVGSGFTEVETFLSLTCPVSQTWSALSLWEKNKKENKYYLNLHYVFFFRISKISIYFKYSSSKTSQFYPLLFIKT